MNNIKVGIIILNYNTYNETVLCIESIKKYTKLPYEIYVVDNASPDYSGKKILKKYNEEKNIHIILHAINQGYSAGNNIGIKRAILDGCNYIFIINSDVELLNNAIDLMVDTLNANSSYMMIGPSVMDNNSCESQLPRKKMTFTKFVFGRHPFCDIPGLKKIGLRFYKNIQEDIYAFYGSVSGCCFGIKAVDFQSIGLFDENVFLYSEEDILAYKMETVGKKAAVNTTAKVWHKANVSTKKEGNAFVQFHRWCSVFYMLKAYAKINKFQQIFVAFWNVLTWGLLSILSHDHKKMLKDFWRKNWDIVKL